MGIKFSVKADVKQAMRMLNDAQRKVVPEAVSASLNRAVKQTRTAIIRESASRLRVKQKVMREWIRFQRRDRATRRNWEAGIFSVVSDIKAAKLGKPRQLKRGAKAGKYMFPGAFKATMASGHTGIYRRVTARRLPIREVKIPIRDTVIPVIRSKIQTVGIPAFRKRFHHELQYRLKRKGLA